MRKFDTYVECLNLMETYVEGRKETSIGGTVLEYNLESGVEII